MRPFHVPILAAVFTSAIALPTWADRVHGDGKPTTQQREVAAFDAIRLDGAIDVVVRTGEPRSVAVTADGNLQPEIVTEVEGGTLRIRTRHELRTKGERRVEIVTPALREFDLAGAGDVRIEGGQGALALRVGGAGDVRWSGTATKLTLEIDGAGDVTLSGTAEALEVEVNGAGDVDARELRARDVEAEIHGAGDVDVTLAGGALRGKVSGVGELTWGGEGRVELSRVSGFGSISRR